MHSPITRRFAIKASFPSLFLSALFLITALPAQAQEMIFRSSDDSNVAMMAIPGGMVLIEGDNEARIARRIIPSQSDTDAPDLQEQDLIIFLNGTRIKSTTQLNTLYEEIAVGDAIKLGIQRGENKMIRTFIKPESQNNYESNDGSRVTRFEFNGTQGDGMSGMENRTLWPAGFIIGNKEGAVIIGSSIPIPNKAEALAALEAGDVITAIDDLTIESTDQLLSAYDAIAVGDDVTVEYKRAGKKEKVQFKKPEAPRMRMRIDGE